MAMLVGCRLIAIWFGAQAIQRATAWVAVVFQVGQFGARGPYSMEQTLLIGVAVSFALAVGLWFAAPRLSRAGGSGTLSMSGDTARSLLKVLGAYFLISSLTEIAQYIAMTIDKNVDDVWRAMGGGQQLVQTIMLLVAGILLIVGVDWIKTGVMKAGRYGLEEPKEPPRSD